MADGNWDILGDVDKALYLGSVGSEHVGGEQSLTMPDPAVSPLADAQGRMMFGAHATDADVAPDADIAPLATVVTAAVPWKKVLTPEFSLDT